MGRLVAFLLKSMVEYFDLQYLCFFLSVILKVALMLDRGWGKEVWGWGVQGGKMSVVVSSLSLSEVFPRMRR